MQVYRKKGNSFFVLLGDIFYFMLSNSIKLFLLYLQTHYIPIRQKVSFLDVWLSFFYTYAALKEKCRPVKLHPDNNNINGLSAIFFRLPSVTLLGVPILWPTIILIGIINLFSWTHLELLKRILNVERVSMIVHLVARMMGWNFMILWFFVR